MSGMVQTELIQIGGAGTAGLAAAITLSRQNPFFGLLLSPILSPLPR